MEFTPFRELPGMTQNSLFVERMCEEGVTLAVEARNYIAYHEKRYRQNYSLPACLRIGYQLTRVTARILQAMSWLLTYRAIADGELPSEHLTAPEYALNGGWECEDASGAEIPELPVGVKSLLERSYGFYMRVARLDAMCRKPVARKRGVAAGVPAVTEGAPRLRLVSGGGNAVNIQLLAE